jgi:hypothetical protein
LPEGLIMAALLGGIVGFFFGALSMGFVWVVIELRAAKVVPSVFAHKASVSIAEAKDNKPRPMDGRSLRAAFAKANRQEYSTEVDDSGIA